VRKKVVVIMSVLKNQFIGMKKRVTASTTKKVCACAGIVILQSANPPVAFYDYKEHYFCLFAGKKY